MIDLKLLADNTKGKRDKAFLELFHNKNYYLVTSNLHYINSAYKFQDKLKLIIRRKDYSNDYIIKEL